MNTQVKIVMKISILLGLVFISCLYCTSRQADYDIVIYGGTSAGVIAAYTAGQAGKKVLLIEPGNRLGGLSSGGLGQTDIGNKYAITGLALDFYRRVGQHYGVFEQWIFEPHVAENIFKEYIKSSKAELLYGYRLKKVSKTKTAIKEITIEYSTSPSVKTDRTVRGKIFIDCSYEGDLMAAAGVSYTIGRESNSQYNETYNGVQVRATHQFPDGVDPYKIKGDSASGLLWGIGTGVLAAIGSGDKQVQTYNFRVCLTNDSANRLPITQPADYQPERYELLLRLFDKRPPKTLRDFLTISIMPNQKTDINNKGAFSTDVIGMNWDYPNGSYVERKKIAGLHEAYTKGLFYFIATDLRVPLHIRNEMRQWGYPKDEFEDNDHFTPQLYVREARRMIGAYVMTQGNCEGRTTVDDAIGLAAYTMDSHNTQRLVINGMVKNEGDIQVGGFGPYPIAYRSVTPKQGDCTNLLVPVCLSASHIAYGSIRMEPVFMVLGQSAAVAACQAIDENVPVQQVNVNKLQHELLVNPFADHRAPDILVDNDDGVSVIRFGHWLKEINQRGCYAGSVLINDPNNMDDSYVRFQPAISHERLYDLYVYISKVPGITRQMQVNIFDGKQTHTVDIEMKNVEIKGQTTSEWVSLGSFRLPQGKHAYIDITNRGATGMVMADAVLFVPQKISLTNQ